MESIKKEIKELIDRINNLYLLEQILILIKNITKD